MDIAEKTGGMIWKDPAKAYGRVFTSDLRPQYSVDSEGIAVISAGGVSCGSRGR